jgi:hypothetical protein
MRPAERDEKSCDGSIEDEIERRRLTAVDCVDGSDEAQSAMERKVTMELR